MNRKTAIRLIEHEIAQLQLLHKLANPESESEVKFIFPSRSAGSALNCVILKLVLKEEGFSDEFIFSDFVSTEYDSLINAYIEKQSDFNRTDINEFIDYLHKTYTSSGDEYVDVSDLSNFDKLFMSLIN